MATDASSDNKHSAAKYIIAGVIIIIVVVALVLLLRGNTTVKHERSETATETSLHCSASDIDNGVFDTYGAISAEYAIDAIFYNDKLDNLTYTYKGVYNDEGTANTARGNIMSAFNLRLQNLSLPENQFGSKTASLDGTTFRYVVYADNDDITVDSAAMLMIDVDKESTSQHIPTSYNELKSNYQAHGFICKSGA